MEIISIIVLGLIVWLGTRILVKTLVGGNDVIGSIVNIEMSEEGIWQNRLDNAETTETIDAVCYEMKLNEMLDKTEKLKREVELCKEIHQLALGKLHSAEEEIYSLDDCERLVQKWIAA